MIEVMTQAPPMASGSTMPASLSSGVGIRIAASTMVATAVTT